MQRPGFILLFGWLAIVPQPASAKAAGVPSKPVGVASHEGDRDSLLRNLEDLSAGHLDDVDLLRRLAAAHAATGELEKAQQTIDRALALAPNDHDIQLARANILLWQGRLPAAEKQGQAIARSAPDYPGLDTFNAALANRRSENRARLSRASFSQSFSRVSFSQGVRQDWTGQEAGLGLSLDAATGFALQLDREQRLATDTRLSARADRRIAGGLAYFGISATPDADFRESWSVSTGVEQRLSTETQLLLDARFAAYRGSDVGVAQAGIRQALGRDLALTVRAINLFGGSETYRIGGSAKLEYAPERRTGYFASVASYPDAEVGGTRQLSSVAAGVIAPVGQHLVLRATGEYEQRRDSYTRKALTIGLGWKFGSPR